MYGAWRASVWAEAAIAKRSFARPRDVWPAWPTRSRHGARKNSTLHEKSVAHPLKRAYSAGWRSVNPARIAAGDV